VGGLAGRALLGAAATWFARATRGSHRSGA
jgi:hypothetical protein